MGDDEGPNDDMEVQDVEPDEKAAGGGGGGRGKRKKRRYRNDTGEVGGKGAGKIMTNGTSEAGKEGATGRRQN